MVLRRSVLLFAGLIAVGCGKDKTSTPSGVSLTTPAGFVTKASTAIETSASAFSGNQALRATRAENCSGMGGSGDADLPTRATSTADYIACMLTTNSQSPETALGALHMAKEILTGIQTNVTLSFPTTAKTTENVDFSVSMSDGTYNVESTLVEQGLNGSPWDAVVNLCIHNLTGGNSLMNEGRTIEQCNSDGFSFSIYLKKSATTIAFKNIARFLEKPEATAFIIGDNALRFESWGFGNGNHIRYLVEGTVSANLDLDSGSITSVNFASAYNEGNWGGLNAVYDGSNVCMRYEQSSGGGALNANLAKDTCTSYPTYSESFHNFGNENETAFKTFIDNESKGILNFTSSTFAIGSLFIDN